MGTAPPSNTWEQIRAEMTAGRDLDAHRAAWIMNQIAGDHAPAPELAAFLAGLNAKGISANDVGHLLRERYAHASALHISGTFVDLAGTGGDRASTVNISTMASIVAAATGRKVVKHGGRASSSGMPHQSGAPCASPPSSPSSLPSRTPPAHDINASASQTPVLPRSQRTCSPPEEPMRSSCAATTASANLRQRPPHKSGSSTKVTCGTPFSTRANPELLGRT